MATFLFDLNITLLHFPSTTRERRQRGLDLASVYSFGWKFDSSTCALGPAYKERIVVPEFLRVGLLHVSPGAIDCCVSLLPRRLQRPRFIWQLLHRCLQLIVPVQVPSLHSREIGLEAVGQSTLC